MVAKLSSVRIITAASLETSVPVMPMATPMSAFFNAGASLTPSPVMATMLSFCWSSVTRILSSGVTRATYADLIQLWLQLFIRNGGELRPCQGLALDAQLVADGGGGHRMVAGNHAHLDAGAVALSDGVFGLGSRRINDSH